MADKTVKIDSELRAQLYAIKDEYNFTVNETVRYLLSIHKEREATKRELSEMASEVHQIAKNHENSSGSRRVIKGATVEERLQLFFDAIIKHNSNEGKGGRLVYLGSANFIHKETGINRTRDVVPFLESVGDILKAHNDRYLISESTKRGEHMKEKDENGQNRLVGEILRREGIAHIFNR